MRLSPALLVAALSLSMTLPALAAPAVIQPGASAQKQEPAKQRTLAGRILRGAGSLGLKALTGTGKFLWRQVTVDKGMKDTLRDVKALRKSGDVEGAADAIVDAQKPVGLRERIAMWRAKKLVIKAARKDMKADKLDADPRAGYAAMKTLGNAGKLSFIDRIRGGMALVKGGKNAFKTAERLGNQGRILEAVEMVEWGNEHTNMSPFAQVKLRVRLHGQALAIAQEAGARYKALPEGPAKEAAFEQMMLHLNAAQTLGSAQNMDITSRLPGRLKRMVGGRVVSTQDVIRSTGLSNEALSAKIEARAMREQGEAMEQVKATTPAAKPEPKSGDQLSLDFEKGEEK